jgi:YD repeat-containing protein
MNSNVKLLLLVAVVVSACEKEEMDLYPLGQGELLLKQVIIDSEPYYEYIYDAGNFLIEEKSKWSYKEHHYKNKLLTTTDLYIDERIFSSIWEVSEAAMNRKEWVAPDNTNKSSTISYLYDGDNRLVRSTNGLSHSVYDYDDHQRILRQTFFYNERQSGYIDYFCDQGGNVIKKQHYFVFESGESELQSTTVYEFDEMHNPYRAFKHAIPPGVYTNVNNITKETITLHFEVDETVDRIQVIDNSYTYNAAGYPISKNDAVAYIYY